MEIGSEKDSHKPAMEPPAPETPRTDPPLGASDTEWIHSLAGEWQRRWVRLQNP